MAVHVLIADDQPEVRSALRLVLDAEPEFEVVKLGLRTRVHAVIYCYEHGLAPGSP